jgi:hydrogenase maturation protease
LIWVNAQDAHSFERISFYWLYRSDTGDFAVHTGVAATHTLVLGLGNILLTDDGVGIHVIKALSRLEDAGEIGHVVALRDGGTIGLALLSEIEEFGSLIVVDAMQLGETAGTVGTFQGPDMDRQLCGKKRSAHEVALADLMMAAQLAGFGPERRALVAIQPASTGWGLSLTDPVRQAVPEACRRVVSLLDGWDHDA